jgi:hypothetical protein
MPMASLNPRRNTAPSAARNTKVTSTAWPSKKSGANGFSSTCADASAADRVIVMRKSVQAKPSITSTNSLPAHQGNDFSSIAIEPSPCGLSRATRR